MASTRFPRALATLVATGLALLLTASQATAAARDVTSYNWAGYAVRGPAVDAVTLEVVVPTVTCPAVGAAASLWAGFGGLTESSLIQSGVQIRCRSTGPVFELFQQATTGSGASTVGPQVAPGDVVRAVVCPAGSTRGSCAGTAPASGNYLAAVAVQKGGTGPFTVWEQSLTPVPWNVSRTEAACITERPKDATTEQLRPLATFTPPTMRCGVYRRVTPPSQVDVANGGGGYSAYRLILRGDPTTRAVEPAPVSPAAAGPDRLADLPSAAAAGTAGTSSTQPAALVAGTSLR